jgi:hypothetical protein
MTRTVVSVGQTQPSKHSEERTNAKRSRSDYEHLQHMRRAMKLPSKQTLLASALGVSLGIFLVTMILCAVKLLVH